jgi:hypothetical protein
MLLPFFRIDVLYVFKTIIRFRAALVDIPIPPIGIYKYLYGHVPLPLKEELMT